MGQARLQARATKTAGANKNSNSKDSETAGLLTASQSLRSSKVWIDATVGNAGVEIPNDSRAQFRGIYSIVPIANWLAVHPLRGITHNHRAAARGILLLRGRLVWAEKDKSMLRPLAIIVTPEGLNFALQFSERRLNMLDFAVDHLVRRHARSQSDPGGPVLDFKSSLQ
ncbi:uncharacterized protein J7T55_012004 [Diaporthe amygdali]|uniref:uncharacterized protein n=1 Tax=Phomopsis amygdali TaxID=1214568 RepID=UPI0022FE1B50|nr:uncharacterized protein J7T55_012004 [Diaporthe amygdali]KAJ0123539.1 uncharacterized protein J7T55_012004 [Diaporthe amygdali]